MPLILKDKDVLAGLLFVVIGAGFAIGALDYGMGSARRMGPGYFPVVLGSALAVIGGALAGRSVLRARPAPIARLHLRPVAALTVAIVAFGLLIDRAGLVAATMAAVLLAGLASRETRPLESLLVAAGMAAFAVVVFKMLLGLPFRIWGA